MSLFKKAEAAPAYLKMGIYGEAGSGKTYTASQIAIGLAQHIAKATKKAPPVMFLDTETGSTWVRPMFEKAGIEFFVANTRSFADLKRAVTEAEAAGAILIADSMTHFWEEVREAFLKKKKERFGARARLELPDWNVIKPEWGKFTTAFLNSRCHIILCGRAGNVYEFQENEENGKKEMITTGTRMASEKGMGYEPNILVEMTAAQVTGLRKKKSIARTATVLKDRSTALDGMQVINPTFTSFAPHIKQLNLGGAHEGFDAKRNSSELFPIQGNEDRTPLQRSIVLDEIQSLLLSHFPGQSATEKKSKVDLLRKHFDAAWTEMEKIMPLLTLRAGYDMLHRELESKPSRYSGAAVTVEPINDEIPDEFDTAPAEAAE